MTIATTLERDTAAGLASGLVGRSTSPATAHPTTPAPTVSARVGACAEVAQHRLRTAAEDRLQRLQARESYAAIWIAVVLIGIFIIGAAALAIYCIRHGHNGAVLDYRTQTIKKFKIPVGIRVSIHCV